MVWRGPRMYLRGRRMHLGGPRSDARVRYSSSAGEEGSRADPNSSRAGEMPSRDAEECSFAGGRCALHAEECRPPAVLHDGDVSTEFSAGDLARAETVVAPEELSAGSSDAVKQLPFGPALRTLGYVFWLVGAMEMIERLAYYGVKAVATLYAKDAASNGGLGITITRFGTILAIWALLECIVPVFTGGLSDRYGYKETIFASTVVKIAGYLTMAAFPSFGGFLFGAVLLATGSAIFKPGLQGTLVKTTKPENSAMAWGIFYQTVNIGGFIGPLVAGFMRKMAWRNVFYANAAIICVNFILLLTYKEPGKKERLEREVARKGRNVRRESLVRESLRELAKPEVWAYLLAFSGFWFMFDSLFDVLPAHIDDWVDTRDIVRTLFGTHGTTNPIVKFFVVMNKDGTAIQPEGMLNVNAGIIMTICFLVAYLGGKLRATTSMFVGTLLASLALALSGWSRLGWASVGAIAIFSVGEMLSSPKFLEFIGNFAPFDKKAMYLGFAQMSRAIGWMLEGKIGPVLYDHYASKENFSREVLVSRGMSAASVDAIPQGEAFSKLVTLSGQTKEEVTQALYATHAFGIGLVWYIMAAVGVVSAAGILAYGRWVVPRSKT
jgi:POT family proton-dependent oligopeptide transporter